ncbi:MAG: flagellar motor switch protein FliG [Sphingomonadales bacterium 32-64-17]|nr:MAG: flagellar motor switch protein FliG [Sphingomonadales bacterium 32-64-17]
MTALTHPQAANAALMVLLMDDDEASALLSRLTPEELALLGQNMCDLGEIAEDRVSEAIRDFAQAASERVMPAEGRMDKVRSVMTSAVGAIRADGVMRRIVVDEPRGPTALEIARWLEPEIILKLVADEFPQTIAVLLVQLDPMVAAQVLAGLPEEDQPEIVHRVATLGPVAPSALTMLEELLENRITESFGTMPLRLGGVREVAEIINSAGKAAEKRILPVINKRDKALYKQIESELFKFEHLFVLDPQAMGALLREVDSDLLIDALKGIDETQRDVFFRAMSSRAADGLKDEIETRGRLKFADVDAAQKRIIEVAKRLIADGTIILGDGDEDYV